ncbi:MAG TPA: di-heme-cytochrome C peroxidase [Methylocella sp.]|nr:di-heme-cytochrome C peroxidase [Methylocella sp.]
MKQGAIVGWGIALQLIFSTLTSPSSAGQDIALDQGWTPADISEWYGMSAGSRLIPLAWLNALEQAGSEKKFLASEHIDRFRYLPNDNAGGSPLPLGFVVDTQSDNDLNATKLRWKAGQGDMEPWVGMNCAACHTAELTFKGKHIRVQGGPTLADFESFVASLDQALVATRDDASKWGRFANSVLGADNNEENRGLLKSALQQFIGRRLDIEKANEAPIKEGYGRLDAFGHIFNDVALNVGAENPQPLPSDAPVSYPFLWNVPQHDKVQWNGIAPNLPGDLPGQPFDPLALVRNSAGMIGAFADVKVTSTPLIFGYSSSLLADNVIQFENKLRSLRPPKWPSDLFGVPDAATVAAGKQLFNEHCARCHEPLPRDDLKTHFKANMIPFAGRGDITNTDPAMACNFYRAQASSGALKEALNFAVFDPIGDKTSAGKLIFLITIGELIKEKKELGEFYIKSYAKELFNIDLPSVPLPPLKFSTDQSPAAPSKLCKGGCEAGTRIAAPVQQRVEECMKVDDPLLAYKARPLTGIWATAPYLHNGSVPTLYDLLLPASQRPRTFFTGTREFDPLKVGYVTTQSEENDLLFETRTSSGETIIGNSNAGHEFGTDLNDEQRKKLIEYLKTL